MSQQRRTARSKKRSSSTQTARPKSLWKKLLLICVSLIGIVIIAVSGLFIFYASSAPSISPKDLQGAIETQILDSNQELIMKLGGENRELITPEDIPDLLKEAITSIEDRRFYSHIGIDPIRMVGSFIRNLKAGQITQGGSTITQQLVKLSVFSTKKEDQTYKRKVQEILLALHVEREYSKEQILTYYLNKVYMANNIYGFGTAANYYFNKPLRDLSLAQIALLAGMPQAPSAYDPYLHPQAAKERRDIVLQAMYTNQKITQAQLQEALATPISQGLITEHEQLDSNDQQLIFDSFLTMVLEEVKEKTGLDPYSDGLTIETTVDSQAQKRLYQILNTNEYIQYIDDDVQNAVVLLDSTSGAVRAINGGRKQTNLLAYNRAVQNDRSTGSTIKPIMDYGPAIEYLNYSTGQTVVDQPTTYSSGLELNNWDHQYLGTMTLRQALVLSRNTPALETFKAVGVDNIQAFLKKLDLTVTNDGTESLVESNAIGANLSPLKMAAAYAAFANYGTYSKPYTITKITTREGHVFSFTSEQHPAMKDSTAYMMTNMLKDSFTYGFAKDLPMNGIPQAAKTGSTNYTPEQKRKMGVSEEEFIIPDSWFIGFSPAYTISVWTGYDQPFSEGSGLNVTEQAYSKWIYYHLMTYLLTTTPATDWEQPSSVVTSPIEIGSIPLSLPGPRTPADQISQELFVRGTVPTQQSISYGKKLADPTGLKARYDQPKKELALTWDAYSTTEGKPTYKITVNGQEKTVDQPQVIFTGVTDQKVTITLQVVVGKHSSDPIRTEVTLQPEKEPSTNHPTSSTPIAPQRPSTPTSREETTEQLDVAS